MASLTQQLRHCNTTSSLDDSILFHHQSVSTKNLTYKQCFEIINEHENWLLSTIHTQLQSLPYIHTNNSIILKDNSKIKDVIIGYLSDNVPDLLLSMLACINLTSTLADSKVLPAMINARWTPKEIEKALSPSTSDTESDGTHHVTIVLYGEGYEQTAKESVQLMSTIKNHFAVALPIPTLSEKYYTNANRSVSVVSDSSQQVNDPSSHRPKQHESLKSTQVSNSTAVLLFTSGTSSPNGAKGVKISHKSLYIQSIAKTHHPCNYNKETSMIATTVPWFHVGGLSSVLAVLFAGGVLVFPPQDNKDVSRGVDGTVKKERKGFQPQKILQSIQPKETTSTSRNISANTLVVVPAMLHSIVEHHNNLSCYQSTTPKRYPNVKLILVGGQSIGSGKLYKSIRNLFPKARIVQTYACTEAGSSITFEDLGY